MPSSTNFAQAVELHHSGKLREAEEAYRRILRAEPTNAAVWFGLAQLCETDRRPVEAIACFRQGLEIKPAEPEAHFLVGNLLLQQRKLAEAEAAYRRCLEHRPDHALALGNLGYVLGELNRHDEARSCYERALQLRPDLAEVHHNLGNVLREQGQLADALDCYNRALERRPEYGKAFINRGIALVAMGQIDPAVEDLRRGVELKPDLPDAHTSLGAGLAVQQRLDEALACYDHALKLKPDHAEAAWNQSLIWLLQGDYERGWPAYEARWRCARTTSLPAYPQPRWDGSPLEGRAILLYAEQGLGDTLHFVRYAPLVKARGGRVLVQCQNALLRLLARTPGIDGLIGWGATPPKFDTWLPLMSLPAVFKTTLDSIPATGPYLFPDPSLVDFWRQQLAPVRGFRVGIAWRGSPRHAWDRHRSVTLDSFAPLAGVAGVQLISLQKGIGSEEVGKQNFPVVNLGPLIDETAGPFMDTAAILANLDLVVTIDTALAHLAGGMGIPTWLALTNTPDWRWLLDRADNLWYPTARLFRQTSFGDWQTVFRMIAEQLPTMADKATRRRPIVVEISSVELADKLAALEAECAGAADATTLQAELDRLRRQWRDHFEGIPELAKIVEELRRYHTRCRALRVEMRKCAQDQQLHERLNSAAREYSDMMLELENAKRRLVATIHDFPEKR